MAQFTPDWHNSLRRLEQFTPEYKHEVGRTFMLITYMIIIKVTDLAD